MLKIALFELARTDREFFVEFFKEVFSSSTAPASLLNGVAKTTRGQKNGKKLAFAVAKTQGKKISADDFLKRLSRYQINLPADYKFNRDEANER